MSKDKIIRSALRFGAAVCFILSALLIIWSVVSKITFLEEKYVEYLNWLSDFERNVAGIGSKWLIVLVVMLLYFVRTAFPIYPISIICVATALVFNTPSAFVLNIMGVSILFSVKYFMGVNSGGGGAQKLIRKISIARKIVESEGQGNPWVLLACRILPCISVNAVSQLYGAMHFPYWKYMLISVFAYLPKMASYIIIGRNVTNPFSLKLSIPLLVLSVVSGITMISLSKAWDAAEKHKDHNQEVN